ncbi:hypothetical protein ACS2CL_19960 [Bacillus cereus group sp. BceL296]|uniref:hypothetical protein n=1 Tax=Bacillus TaxID=1386 RepID=UPI0001A12BCE|nr:MULTISPECIES: hypothetical protein [Bacillus]EEL73201.1 hypothetical protein bcere0027_55200 [Bacillus cereus AH676]EOP99078.1 hypothetical protein IIY_05123 [Bacillus cereus VD140]KMP42350.1 hypothetical protein TU56_26250 [Bacillus cereus]KZD36253.1 hypothetical protein B4081_1905 [Bacillus cereus]MBM6770556.1 hypothetical protein [Bacillus cereus]
MGYSIQALRNFNIDRASYKVIIDDNDIECTDWSHKEFRDFYDFLESAGLDTKSIFELLPIDYNNVSLRLTELEDKDMDFLESLTHPNKCIQIINQYKLIELAEGHTAESYLIWLRDLWTKGFFIILGND